MNIFKRLFGKKKEEKQPKKESLTSRFDALYQKEPNTKAYDEEYRRRESYFEDALTAMTILSADTSVPETNNSSSGGFSEGFGGGDYSGGGSSGSWESNSFSSYDSDSSSSDY